MYTKILQTNLKGPAREIELSNKTLIVGDNEAGKSAITQSIQLCLKGSATGLLFRDEVKLASALLTMAPAGQPLNIVAKQDSGEAYRYELLPGKKAKHVAPDSAMNLDSTDIRAAFSGSVDRMVAFLGANIKECMGWRASYDTMQAEKQSHKELSATFKDAEARLNRCGAPDAITDKDVDVAIMERGMVLGIKSLAAKAKANENTDLLAALNLAAREWGKPQFAEGGHPSFDNVMDKARSRIAWADIDELKKQKDDTEIAMLAQKHRVTQAEAHLDMLTKAVVSIFEAKVTPYLHAGEALSLDMDSGYTYLLRGGKRYAALSGSTEARVLAAMASALAEPGKPGVLVLDDRMWSEANLLRTMTALQNAPCQVIITSTVAVEAEGWAVLYV